MTEKVLWGIIGTLVTGLAFGGWQARDYIGTLATKEEVKVAGTKADYALDRQMRALERDINYLIRKKNKTVDDIETLRYLRETLKEMREVRDGKK